MTRPFVPVCGARECGSQTVAFAADQPRAAQCAPRDDVKAAHLYLALSPARDFTRRKAPQKEVRGAMEL